MKNIHLGIVSVVLFGPILSLVVNFWKPGQFLFGVFPITADSLAGLFNPKVFSDFDIIDVIFLLFFIKVLVVGGVCWIRLYMKQNGSTSLMRFYLLVMVICLLKMAGTTMLLADSFDWWILFSGLLPMLTWVAVLIWAMTRLRITGLSKQSD